MMLPQSHESAHKFICYVMMFVQSTRRVLYVLVGRHLFWTALFVATPGVHHVDSVSQSNVDAVGV